MERKKRKSVMPAPTSCDTMRRYSAPIHGTMQAYNKWHCRCQAAIKARQEWRTKWRQSESGKLSIKRYNERRRAAAASCPTNESLLRTERRVRGLALVRAGHSVPDVAARCGVHPRTVERWREKWL